MTVRYKVMKKIEISCNIIRVAIGVDLGKKTKMLDENLLNRPIFGSEGTENLFEPWYCKKNSEL